jgi:hypothetical protein
MMNVNDVCFSAHSSSVGESDTLYTLSNLDLTSHSQPGLV